MALDFYPDGSDKRVFTLDDKRLSLLDELLEQYVHRTGLRIDPYADGKLPVESLRILLRIIDEYKRSADLNRHREPAAAILGVGGLLQYCVDNGIDLRYTAD